MCQDSSGSPENTHATCKIRLCVGGGDPMGSDGIHMGCFPICACLEGFADVRVSLK